MSQILDARRVGLEAFILWFYSNTTKGAPLVEAASRGRRTRTTRSSLCVSMIARRRSCCRTGGIVQNMCFPAGIKRSHYGSLLWLDLSEEGRGG
eukprot:2185151-Pyramimonas_sp.AAC.1